MKKSKLVEGRMYKFDPVNTLHQSEIGIKKVMVKSIRRFKRNVIVIPVTSQGVMIHDEMEVHPSFLYELDSQDENMVVRYPIDIPVFSENDYQVLLMAARIFLEQPAVTAQLAVGMQALLSKVEYYSAISSVNRPMIVEEENEH